MIKITNLHYSYSKNNYIFSNINLTIKFGHIYGLLGENGVGKTTLLRLICGLLFPKTGSCEVLGNESHKRLPDMLEKIYYLPEVFDTPAIKITEYKEIYSHLYPNFDNNKFEEYLEKFSIDKNKKMKNFSHGQHKKAMLAFALACKTPVLLLDEPTNGLDIPSKAIFRQIIASAINKDTVFVISTHQVKDLENLIDPIIILEQNQIILNNTIAEITEKLKFTLETEPKPNTLYCEQMPGGYLSVELNDNKTDSKVNMEALFNAAIQNKEFFKNNFN